MISQYFLILAIITIVNASIYYDINNDDYEEVKNSRNFTGKVVLVTGSNSGIGEGIVKLFSILGANVVVTGREADDVQRVAKEVEELSPKKLKVYSIIVWIINIKYIFINSRYNLSEIWPKVKSSPL